MMLSDHITQMGFRLEYADEARTVKHLLEACGLEAMLADAEPHWHPSRYLLACTRAGGVAACVGWDMHESGVAVIHSLAVAPPTRGSGIGGGLLANAMASLVEGENVRGFWLATSSGNARHLFWSLGFATMDAADVPHLVAEHPAIAGVARGTVMARLYGDDHVARGLDRTAFRLIQNDTHEATLPHGSVFFFRQTSQVVEASYRGGPVVRGHLMGQIVDGAIDFCWHQFVHNDADPKASRLMNGDGRIVIELMEDGRRQLRERFEGSGELLLREI